MWACTFTSKRNVALLVFVSLITIASSFAQPQIPAGPNMGTAGTPPDSQPSIPQAPRKLDQPGLFEPSSPYLEYGDFNLGDDEDQEALYYQYGRFFGVSVGAGYQSATGNRGKVYDSALPRIDLKVHYWFDFQFALNFGIMIANHTYQISRINHKVGLTGFNVDFKYYFDVKNMGAALTFANPYILGGVGVMSKTDSTITTTTTPDTDSTFSVGAGAGLEFPIVHRSSYFLLEARYFTQSFQDSTDPDTFSSRGVDGLSGGFYSLMAHLLFTW